MAPGPDDQGTAPTTRDVVVGVLVVAGVVILAITVILWLTVPGLFGPYGTQPAPGYSP